MHGPGLGSDLKCFLLYSSRIRLYYELLIMSLDTAVLTCSANIAPNCGVSREVVVSVIICSWDRERSSEFGPILRARQGESSCSNHLLISVTFSKPQIFKVIHSRLVAKFHFTFSKDPHKFSLISVLFTRVIAIRSFPSFSFHL